MQRYRDLLRLPGMRPLVVLLFFARVPGAATSLVLALHVAVGLGRGYGEAGLVGAAVTVGMAVGAPYLGRVVDRYGLRPMLLIATIGETAFWLALRFVPYGLLLPMAFVGGLVALPAMAVGRQAVAAIAPPELRRTGYSLDSVSVEIAFMISPGVAVLLATRFSTATATTLLGIAVLLGGSALMIFNPRISREPAGATRLPRRTWLTPRLIGVLAVAGGATFVLSGMDVAIVAAFRETDQLDWTGVAVGVCALASAIGGLVHGMVRRSLPQLTLMTLLSVLTLPVGFLAGGPWWLLTLALTPACAACAPTIAATGEDVARLVPPAAAGEAAGIQSSAFVLGVALGSPVVGFVLDHGGPIAGFAAAGAGGLVVAAGAALLARTPSNSQATPDPALHP
ncbi:MFS transporter [Actinokineospora sp. G85]|uniref:MFS transporter n=1 Tax=Actinokineospora sp. G85 TaxID=3406626 RepID=UPI003C71E894